MKINESYAGIATSATRVIEMYYPEDKRIIKDVSVQSYLKSNRLSKEGEY